jgi:hypothetical protein
MADVILEGIPNITNDFNFQKNTSEKSLFW